MYVKLTKLDDMYYTKALGHMMHHHLIHKKKRPYTSHSNIQQYYRNIELRFHAVVIECHLPTLRDKSVIRNMNLRLCMLN